MPLLPVAGSDELDSTRCQLRCHEPAREVVAALRHATRVAAERRDPGSHVCRLSADGSLRRRQRVCTGCERLAQADDHVEQRVTEGRDHT